MPFSISTSRNFRSVRSIRRWLLRRPIHVAAQQQQQKLVSTTSRQELIVVRHGETDWNRFLRVQGSTDIPLNEKGKAQAEACANALKNDLSSRLNTLNAAVSIYSSPLQRALDTATTISRFLSKETKTDTSVCTTHALKEWNLGVLEGLTKGEASMKYPEDWRVFAQWASPSVSPNDFRKPLTNGESMEQVRWRIVDFINGLGKRHREDGKEKEAAVVPDVIICVTHGGVLGQLLRHAAERESVDPSENEYKRPANACISKFSIEYNDPTAEPLWEIASWANTDHLVGDLAPASANYDKKS